MSSTNAAEQAILGFFAALSAKDAAAFSALVRADVTWTLMTASAEGGYRAVGVKAAVAQFLKGGDGVFVEGDPKTSVRSIVCSGDRAMAETAGTGHRRDGKPYNGIYAWAFELADGLIAHIREYTDTAYAQRFFDMSE